MSKQGFEEPSTGMRLDSPWQLEALCRTKRRPDDFFPEGTSVDAYVGVLAAMAVCEGCPVRAQCLQQAMQYDEKYGIWGGVDFDRSRRKDHKSAEKIDDARGLLNLLRKHPKYAA